MGDLTKNFDRSEFACPCGCGFDDVDLGLVDSLQKIRDVLGVPLRINSGCRCMAHNESLPDAVPHSAHTRGRAADVSCWDSEMRFRLIKAALGFDFLRIGVAKTYTHLDNDPFLPEPRIWVY